MEYLADCVLNGKDLMQSVKPLDFDEKEKDAIIDLFRTKSINGRRFLRRYDDKAKRSELNQQVKELFDQAGQIGRVKEFLQTLRYYPMWNPRRKTLKQCTCENGMCLCFTPKQCVHVDESVSGQFCSSFCA